MGPREGVVSCLISQGLQRCAIAEASKSCSIVIVNEGMNEGISFIVGIEFVFAAIAAGGGCILYSLGDAAVEALGHAIGLGPERAGELMSDALGAAHLIEGMESGGLALRLSHHIDGEAIGELGAITGEDGVDRMAEGFQEAIEACGDGLGIALFYDLDIDETRRPLDGDEDVGLGFAQGRQMLKVHMHEAEGVPVEATRLFGGRPLRPAKAMALEAAVDRAAGKLFIHAAAHNLGKIIEWQSELAPQFQDEFFLERGEADGKPFGRMRPIGDGCAAFPAPDGRLAYSKLTRKVRNGGGTLLDVGPRLGRGRRIGVQSDLHEARRSFRKRMPCCTLILSSQSPGTKHLRGDGAADRSTVLTAGIIRHSEHSARVAISGSRNATG